MYASSQSWRMLDAYFADVGVVNRLALRGDLLPGSELYGKAFENWVFHELSAFVSYADVDARLSYWRLPSGIVEVDFLLGDIEVAIEAKASARINRSHLRGLRTLADEHPDVRHRVVVSLEPRARRTEDGIDILPATTFASRLWAGGIGIGGKARRAFTPILTFPHQGGRDYRK